MNITKLQVAEKEIVAAVNLLFGGGDAVPAYVLAASAREITTTLCEKRGLRSFIDEAHDELPKLSRRDIYREASRHAGFFKHADRDPEGVLVNFADTEADMVLFVSIYDLGELCGGMPIEAQVFEGWFLTLHMPPDSVPAGLDDLFPNLRHLSRSEQMKLGKQVLDWARTVRNFKMTYSVEVRPQQSNAPTPP